MYILIILVYMSKLHGNLLRLILSFEYIFLILTIKISLYAIYTNHVLFSILAFFILLLAATDAALGLSFLVRAFSVTKTLVIFAFNRISI